MSEAVSCRVGGDHGKTPVDDESEKLIGRKHSGRKRVRWWDDPRCSLENREDQTNLRALRSKYIALKTLINDGKDDLLRFDSDKFSRILNELENLHQQVRDPKEQVTDADALSDIADALVIYGKSLSNEGITPLDFVNCLITDFGVGASTENEQILIRWKEIGLAVSPIFRNSYGCCTMLGPMNDALKQRKTTARRKRRRPTESAQPEELDDSGAEEKKDTDKNMSTMFEILREKKHVRLECFILNRMSFAQTVENLFALSFLVKDGRAEIIVDEKGSHVVSPKNASAANSIESKEVKYSHFVFRLDFKDWKLMIEVVPVEEELMPHRERSYTTDANRSVPTQWSSQAALPATPIRKLSRNHGLVMQEEYIEDSPELYDNDATGAGAVRKCKPKFH